MEQIVDIPVPQMMEEIIEVAVVIPQERIQQREVDWECTSNTIF